MKWLAAIILLFFVFIPVPGQAQQTQPESLRVATRV